MDRISKSALPVGFLVSLMIQAKLCVWPSRVLLEKNVELGHVILYCVTEERGGDKT